LIAVLPRLADTESLTVEGDDEYTGLGEENLFHSLAYTIGKDGKVELVQDVDAVSEKLVVMGRGI
jgi:hypothetical protein